MSDPAPDNTKPPRRPWIAPTLTRHESLSAMTQQYYPPQDPYGQDPNNPFRVYGDSVPASGGFFV